ncbi:Stigma-specific protein Stig1 [Macleaya cordata]|uniref:Stigma-specific protein Stig1 n=1 Tax=Macleaya cordata TaxID=56857 RepID=A0A200PYY2_MACCD|nr:Stigma-specific protein Stig1 [Macleaya cordata]
MKLIKLYLIVVVLAMASVLSIHAKSHVDKEDEDQIHVLHDQSQENFSLRRLSHYFHAHRKPVSHHNNKNCNKFPMICQAKGSPGPHCCKKKCVNVLKDRQNCGLCGKKCKYTEICCRGKCVNPSFDKRHCGGCSNRCNGDGFCAFGLCNYA